MPARHRRSVRPNPANRQIRALREELRELKELFRAVAERKPTPEPTPPASIASDVLGEALRGVAAALASGLESQQKLMGTLIERAAKNALSEPLRRAGREGGLKSQANKRAGGTESAEDAVAQIKAYCEECAAKLEHRQPNHNNDMMKHGAEHHESQFLNRLLAQQNGHALTVSAQN